MKLAFIIDPISLLDPAHDSSVAMMEAAQILGHEVWITQINQLSAIAGKAWATLQPVQLKPVNLVDGHWQVDRDWYQVGKGIFTALEEMDAVFMRTDPPVTIPYLYATYILDLIAPEKTLVINSPNGLRTANEKMYALQFPSVNTSIARQRVGRVSRLKATVEGGYVEVSSTSPSVIPETIVSQDKAVIGKFVEAKQKAVLKPLGGKGGEGILFLEAGDRNFNSLVEISTRQGQEPVMIQEYLPAAKEGDKRIILLDGKPIGAVNRIPTGNEFRGNMAVGGRVAQVNITDREKEICDTVAPKLKADGLYFVGLDVIGGYLTEVNVTSPTGIREIDRLNNVSLGKEVIKWLEGKI